MVGLPLRKIFTEEEISKGLTLYRELRKTGSFADRFCAEIVTPNLGRINKEVGRENDPMSLAYAFEHAIMCLTEV